MRKAMLYGAAVFILLWVAKLAITPPGQTAAMKKASEKTVKVPEKFVALKVTEVKWPAEKRIEPRKPPPPPTPVPKPETQKPSTAKTKKGRTGSQQTGGYNIVGDFQCSVEAYLQHMRRQQAMVVVYDGRKKRFWELTATGKALPIENLSGRFSPQTRRLTDDFPNRSDVLSAVSTKYGPGNYEILLLMPEALDRHIKASIEALLKRRMNLSDLTAVHMTYRQEGGVFTATVDWGLVNGKKVTVGQSITI